MAVGADPGAQRVQGGRVAVLDVSTRLLDRSSRHAELTDAGAEFPEHTERVLAITDQALAVAGRRVALRFGFGAAAAGSLGAADRQPLRGAHRSDARPDPDSRGRVGFRPLRQAPSATVRAAAP